MIRPCLSLFPSRPFACCLTQTRCNPTFVKTAVTLLDWPLRAWLGWWTRSWAGLVRKKWPRRYSSESYNNWKKMFQDKSVFLQGCWCPVILFSLYLFLCLSLFLSMSLYLSLSVSLYFSLCLFICLSLSLSISLCLSLSVCQSVAVSQLQPC